MVSGATAKDQPNEQPKGCEADHAEGAHEAKDPSNDVCPGHRTTQGSGMLWVSGIWDTLLSCSVTLGEKKRELEAFFWEVQLFSGAATPEKKVGKREPLNN